MKKSFILSIICLFSASFFAQTNGKLTVSFTTATAGGDYTSKNAVAVWVQNSSNQIQKTLLLNSNNSNSSGSGMSVWFAAIGSNFANRATYKDVDGITAATNSDYGTKTCYWGNTVNLSSVTDGTYTVKMELLDGHLASLNSAGHYVATYTFTKGITTNSGILSGILPACFKNVTIGWLPAATALNEVDLSTLYSIYPNPAISNIYINGPGLKAVNLFNLEGKKMLTTNLAKLNISALKKGEYIVNIETDKTTISKKLIKQ